MMVERHISTQKAKTDPLTMDDRDSIRELLYKFGRAVDSGDADLMRSIVTVDARFCGRGMPDDPTGRKQSGEVVGVEGFANLAIATFEQCRGQTRHVYVNPIITGGGLHAVMRSLVFVYRAGLAPQAGLVATGDYRDEVVRDGGQWRFAVRECLVDPIPTDQPPSDFLVIARDEFVRCASANRIASRLDNPFHRFIDDVRS